MKQTSEECLATACGNEEERGCFVVKFAVECGLSQELVFSYFAYKETFLRLWSGRVREQGTGS